MSLKQSLNDPAKGGDKVRDRGSNCWLRRRDCACLRVEVRTNEVFIFPYQQFLGAQHARQPEGETLIISFSSHEITVSGRELSEIASALQDLSIDWIKTIPARYRGLPNNNGAWITQIDLKAVA